MEVWILIFALCMMGKGFCQNSNQHADQDVLHNATSCYYTVDWLELECHQNLVINVNSSWYRQSNCSDTYECCPSPDDCSVDGRLNDTKYMCDGEAFCEFQAGWVNHQCNDTPTDYEVAYYYCVEASTLMDATTADSAPTGDSPADDGSSTVVIVVAVVAVVVGIIIIIVCIICCKKRKTPQDGKVSKAEGPADDPADDPAKYYEIDDMNVNKDNDEPHYESPDQMKPSLKPKPKHIRGVDSSSSKVPEEGEMEDVCDTSMPHDPNLIQQADRFDPSKNNVAFVPGGESNACSLQKAVSGPGNDYSYAYGHWGTETDTPQSPTSDSNDEFQDNEVYNSGLKGGDNEVIMAENDAHGGGDFERPPDDDNDGGMIIEDNDAYSLHG